METKELDLGAGWKATIHRPTTYRWFQWIDMVTDREEPVVVEKGMDPVEAPAPKQKRLGPEFYRFLETDFVPEVVEKFVDPAGKTVKPHDLYLPDLGVTRLTAIGMAAMQMMREANDSFRGGAGGVAAGGDEAAVPPGEAHGAIAARPSRRGRG